MAKGFGGRATPLLNLYQNFRHLEQPFSCSPASLHMTGVRLGGCGPVNVRVRASSRGRPGHRPAPTLPVGPCGCVRPPPAPAGATFFPAQIPAHVPHPAASLSFRGTSDEVGGSQVTGYRGLGTWGPGPSPGTASRGASRIRCGMEPPANPACAREVPPPVRAVPREPVCRRVASSGRGAVPALCGGSGGLCAVCAGGRLAAAMYHRLSPGGCTGPSRASRPFASGKGMRVGFRML